MPSKAGTNPSGKPAYSFLDGESGFDNDGEIAEDGVSDFDEDGKIAEDGESDFDDDGKIAKDGESDFDEDGELVGDVVESFALFEIFRSAQA